MNIALTGSSGLIGSRLSKDLQNMRHNLFCISSTHSSPENNIFSYEDMLECKIPQPIDCIIHLASINSQLRESEIASEVAITEKIITSMKVMGCKKIIFFSSAKVYGDNSFEHQIFTERSPLYSTCSYSKAKILCEDVIAKSAQKESFNYIVFRMPPVLINHPKSNIGTLFKVVQKGLPIPSFAAGDLNKRSFLSYELLCSVIESALEPERKFDNEIFNLSNTKILSTNDLFREIAFSMSKKSALFYCPNFIFRAMLRVNRLQLLLCRLFGNFHMSNAKLLKEFDLQVRINP